MSSEVQDGHDEFETIQSDLENIFYNISTKTTYTDIFSKKRLIILKKKLTLQHPVSPEGQRDVFLYKERRLL